MTPAAYDARVRTSGLDLAPFRALRYAPGRTAGLAGVTSPPYDVVVRPDGQRALETADAHNIVRLILPPSPDRAAATLTAWRRDGILVREDLPALYVYEQRAAGTVLQRGLIGALRLTPPAERVVLPHEDVMPDVVAERAALLRATATNFEPLLLSYRGHADDAAATAVDTAAADPPWTALTTDDGVEHRLWRVADPARQAAVTHALAAHHALIADGHHRWATCLRLRDEQGARPPWDRTLVLLVDTARHPLRVQAIHRVLPGLRPADALARLTGAFRVRQVAAPLDAALRTLDATPGTAFLLADNGGSFHLLDRPDRALLERTVPADRPAAWRRLDATVLHATLLDALWHVPDRPGAIAYLHDAPAAVAQAARLGGTAVLLRPVREETVRALAERGVTMPRKSTSFGPKPLTGLVMRALTDQS
ncbi:DUF1015 family protein [Streptomyces avicenniae]|uniref:DUF1015 family protein n=1 Tax=Streptomyces avicenniae TaxID=500153 RepID=UPI00069C94D9|nr:DUF1015 domain-containing protein [Streptomyces avicenniae]